MCLLEHKLCAKNKILLFFFDTMNLFYIISLLYVINFCKYYKKLLVMCNTKENLINYKSPTDLNLNIKYDMEKRNKIVLTHI